MKLYGYWRSSAAYRVRVALNLKNIACQLLSVHLVKNGGEQHHDDYVDLNPTHLVPTLIDGELVLNQSMAIIDYLDSVYPDVALYPEGAAEKAIVQSLALDIACEIHPVNNLRIQQYLASSLNVNDQDKLNWTLHWMNTGFTALETRLKKTSGDYCYKNQITVADLCLVPQVYNANRFGVDMSQYPIITAIVERCNQQPAFIDALPENQSDAQ